MTSPLHSAPSRVVHPVLKVPAGTVPDLGGVIIGLTIAFPTTVTGSGALVACLDCNVSPGSIGTVLAGLASVASPHLAPIVNADIAIISFEGNDFLLVLVIEAAIVNVEATVYLSSEISKLTRLSTVTISPV